MGSINVTYSTACQGSFWSVISRVKTIPNLAEMDNENNIGSQSSASMSETSPDSKSSSRKMWAMKQRSNGSQQLPGNGNDDPKQCFRSFRVHLRLLDIPQGEISKRLIAPNGLIVPLALLLQQVCLRIKAIDNASPKHTVSNPSQSDVSYRVDDGGPARTHLKLETFPTTKGKGKRPAESEEDEEVGEDEDERRRSGPRHKRSEDVQDDQRDDEETESDRPLTPRTAGAQSAGAVIGGQAKMKESAFPPGNKLSQIFKDAADGEDDSEHMQPAEPRETRVRGRAPKKKKKKYLPLQDVDPLREDTDRSG